MSDEKRAQIEQILTDAQVKFSAMYRGETTRDDDWKCDEWSCTFRKIRTNEPQYAMGAGLGGKVEKFEFYTGLGHREENPVTVRNLLQQGYKRHLHASRFFDAAKPVPPHAADVLYSLILDSSACEMSFADWCANFGYDTDSRKAFATYEACQQNANKLSRIFTHAQIASIREALEDY